MKAISYSEARQNLSATMLQTVEDRTPKASSYKVLVPKDHS